MTTPDDKTLDDLVDRCRRSKPGISTINLASFDEATDAITALRERIAALEAELKLAVGMLDVALAERNRCREELGLLQKDSVSIFEWLNRKGGLGLDVHRRIDTFLATWRKQ